MYLFYYFLGITIKTDIIDDTYDDDNSNLWWWRSRGK